MSALTLACVCPGDVNAAICTPTGLWLNINTIYVADVFLGGMTGATEFSQIQCSLGAIGIPGGGGTYHIALPLSWLAVWPTIAIHLGFDASLFQSPIQYPGATFSWTFNLETDLICVNPITGDSETQKIFSLNTEMGTNECITGTTIRSFITIGVGSAFGSLFLSTPLGDCNGTSLTEGLFEPDPNSNTTLDTGGTSGDFCLCATGGTAPYRYFLSSGQLPCGETLNGDTGCIEGSPDGTCQGTSSVTFGVIDSAGNQASVTCNLIQHCTSPAAIGNSFY
jgi:hypothetical protein